MGAWKGASRAHMLTHLRASVLHKHTHTAALLLFRLLCHRYLPLCLLCACSGGTNTIAVILNGKGQVVAREHGSGSNGWVSGHVLSTALARSRSYRCTNRPVSTFIDTLCDCSPRSAAAGRSRSGRPADRHVS
jgi:hypothetical protein